MTPTTDCPLCDASADNDGDLRVHLMTDHRKSELVAVLLDLEDGTRDPELVPA